ncbi:hypothetical protein SAMN05444358_10318 [Ruegeria halocynthiae]|uniref:Membrane-bound lysozyme-inhibitor of c-type lysozyme n=1 Tax=Ruegeria halocynthiae TaxID=985054 RepID=A0A1H2YXL6_9RHOB|nr:hypothetical protein [Ruegeria halocynthiae]SDX09876.1 hypothetical protein SAMN05444358_10318 [Ruegeria halocynthiae]
MRKTALLLALLPTVAFAEERVFECDAPDAEHPEMAARLVKYDGQQKGHITIGEINKDVDVYPGLDTLTYLYIGDDYTLHYNVHPEKGTYDYSASGSKSGWGKGTCIETTGQ